LAETGASEGASDGKAAGIRRFAVPGVATTDFPFSHVVIDGTYAFLSGIVASDLPGGAAALAISRARPSSSWPIREALAYVGLGMERIVRVDAHLTEIGRMPEFDRVYRRFFPNGAFPARTCTQLGGLAGGSSLESQ
jgi:2-iminobutanoate/2-iminopropanoate deaminase